MMYTKLSSAVFLFTVAVWYGSRRVSCQDVRLSELPEWAWIELVGLLKYPDEFLTCVVNDKVLDQATKGQIIDRLIFLEIWPLKNISVPSVKAALAKVDDDAVLSDIILDLWEKFAEIIGCANKVLRDHPEARFQY